MLHSSYRRAASRVVIAATCAAVLLAPAACTNSTSAADSQPAAIVDSNSASAAGFRGDHLAQPVTLTASDLKAPFHTSTGANTTLGTLQRGKLMLLYFGYTNCPDVCPTTMADIGEALRKLPSVEQAHIQVVFVTSDPARDTPSVLKVWLGNFDSGLPLPFVGLTAGIKQIDGVAKSIGIPLAAPVKQADGSITVQHGAQTLAFLRGRANVLWTAGTTPGGYAHDLGKLVTRIGG